MSEAWSYQGGPPTPAGTSGDLTLLDGSTFCISDLAGDITPGGSTGLFIRDTRFVSTWLTRLDGNRLEPLTVQARDAFSVTHVARGRPERGLADSSLLVLLERRVGEGMCMQVQVRNLSDAEVNCTLSMLVDADFADLFDVKEGRAPDEADVLRTVDEGVVRVTLVRDGRHRALSVSGSGGPVLAPGSLTWHLHLAGRSRWTALVEADVHVDGCRLVPTHRCGGPVEEAGPAVRIRQWRSGAPTLTSSDPGLARTITRSVEDLGSLRIADPAHPERNVVAAGSPWFMALFGRDALLTSLMSLPLDLQLASGTLQSLAELQGTRLNPASEEEPGRIPHEARFGPGAVLALGGGNVYYGTVDASPLFVMLLGELHRYGADADQVRAVLPHADRALAWVEQYGDRDGDGFVEYERATPQGLANQGWKDSFDGINFADGTLAQTPIALCEVQGYVYAALLARARIAESDEDAGTAQRCRDRAARLKTEFNERFWLPGPGWLAVGLDRDKRPIDALTSNVGHCLWTGIVDDDKAAVLADHLASARMFTGWGVRTLASDMGSYNPMSYHNGSVWPHDSALVAAGLMRYGYVERAQLIAAGLLDAAKHFGGRLPELFCGFDRDDFPEPVPYPTSCSPQAWSAAAPLHLIRTLLRLEPGAATGTVSAEPAVPWRYLPLTLDWVTVAGTRVRLSVDGNGSFEWQPPERERPNGLHLGKRGRPY